MEQVGSHGRAGRQARRSALWRVARWLVWSLVVLVAVPSVYFGAAYGLARIAINTEFVPADHGVPIGVSSNGAHANLHLPVRALDVDWTAEFPPTDFPAAPLWADTISFGWGNRDFYLNTPRWSDFDLWLGFKAIVGIGGSALHVAYWPPLLEGEAYTVVTVSPEAYLQLVAHIRETIAPDAAGNPQRIEGYSYSGNDGFYEARGTYTFVVTCNEWVRRGLAEAGIRTGVWTPLPEALLTHLRAARADGGT